ncbi:hypothetical protein LDENG_00152340 [Lucifuga dentata]|nr:hypothetical protein LDENG_00152340 [Lucifuga dentata]
MSGIVLCEPLELYNMLNQRGQAPRLAEINYLCLVDARESQDYNVSHIITAKNARTDSAGKFLRLEAVEADSMQRVLVYDSDTCCLQAAGRAVDCAQMLAETSLHPVCIITGGFQRFSALYPFLRTEKIMYTIMELENLRMYPLEILAGLLYMSDNKQAADCSICEDLKIGAVVIICQSSFLQPEKENQNVLHIPLADSAASDLFSSFKKICIFIGSHVNKGSRVLICSDHGVSRCSAVAIAFLMHHLKYTLEEAWRHLLRCKADMRPNVGFMQQLSDWELHSRGTRLTDISEL